jgi:hypothetical protein
MTQETKHALVVRAAPWVTLAIILAAFNLFG